MSSDGFCKAKDRARRSLHYSSMSIMMKRKKGKHIVECTIVSKSLSSTFQDLLTALILEGFPANCMYIPLADA